MDALTYTNVTVLRPGTEIVNKFHYFVLTNESMLHYRSWDQYNMPVTSIGTF